MNKFESRVRRSLDSAAREAGHPAPLARRRVRWIRKLQATWIVLSAGVFACLVFVAVWGIAFLPGGDATTQAVLGQAPSSQTLYVLDGSPDGLSSEGSVMRVTAGVSDANVSQRYVFGAHPDAVLSPDGARLYGVGFPFDRGYDGNQGVLRVFDTATGRLVAEAEVSGYPGTMGFRMHPLVAISPGGSRVYVVVGYVTPSDRPLSVATFDVASRAFLTNQAPIEDCRSWPILLPTSDQQVAVVCPGAEDVRFVHIEESGQLGSERRLDLGVAGIADAALAADAGSIYAVASDGTLLSVSISDRGIQSSIDLKLGSDRVAPAQVQLASNGMLLIGQSAGIDLLQARDLLVVDASTGETTTTISTLPFSAFSIASDGTRVFTVNYDSKELNQVGTGKQLTPESLGQVADRALGFVS